jgi:hypothetical protein
LNTTSGAGKFGVKAFLDKKTAKKLKLTLVLTGGALGVTKTVTVKR